MKQLKHTLKQKLAAEKIVALKLQNRGKNGILGKAMRAAGYSKNTAKNPKQNLMTSKAWPELREKYLPDEEILAVHKNALHATKIHGSLTEPDRIVEDIPTQLKAAELAYKVKGRLSETTVNQQFNLGNESKIEFIEDTNADQTEPLADDSSPRPA